MAVHDERTVSRTRQEPPVPDVYLPAMWPVGLERYLSALLGAWRRRRLYRRLLALEDRELAARDLDRTRLQHMAHQPLRQVMTEGRRP